MASDDQPIAVVCDLVQPMDVAQQADTVSLLSSHRTAYRGSELPRGEAFSASCGFDAIMQIMSFLGGFAACAR